MNDLLEKGLPANLDAERFVLGALLLDHPHCAETLSQLDANDFSLEKHRRIFARMQELDVRGAVVDRVTVANELSNRSQLESVDGLTYLVSLDDGIPQFFHIEAYVRIVQEKAALRKIIFASQALMNRCLVADTDSAELIALADSTLAAIGYRPSEAAEMLTPIEVIEKAGGLELFIHPLQGAGAKTPWPRLTEMTSGYRRGELVVIAGNPSMGKTAASLQVAMTAAEGGLERGGVLIFSLEMSREALVTRMACCRGRVDSARLRAGYLNFEERSKLRRAINDFADWPLWIAEHGISTVSGIRAAVRKKKAKAAVFMVVIDYLQLLHGIGRAANRNAEVSEITRSLKLLAVEENINVQLLSQLNRDNLKEKRAPALHDLRESGSIEQDADAVMFTWRPEMLWRDREDLHGLAELLLLKQRNGPTGKIDLVWLAGMTRFDNRVEDLSND